MNQLTNMFANFFSWLQRNTIEQAKFGYFRCSKIIQSSLLSTFCPVSRFHLNLHL